MSKQNTNENHDPNKGAASAKTNMASATQPVDIPYRFLRGYHPLFSQTEELKEVAPAASAATAHVSTANDCDIEDGFFGPMEGI